MDKRSTFRVTLIAAALASTGGFAGAQAVITEPGTSSAIVSPVTSGFVGDSRGEVVRSSTGECVVPGTGASISGVPDCGALMLSQAVTPPVAAEQVQPAPAAPAPMRRITLDADTTFNFDSAELTDEGKEQLRDIVEAGGADTVDRLRIHITGYADRIGPEEYNLSLSAERANTVRDYLVSEGLPADMITLEGRGETNPVVQCEGMSGVTLIECLRPNRRSEVEFAALERSSAEQVPSEQAPGSSGPWAPGTDTGTPR